MEKLQTKHTTNSATLIFTLLTVLILSGCKSTFLGTNTRIKEEFQAASLPFEYFSTKTKFKFKDGEEKMKATANIRIKKDSIIWFTLTPGLGYEAARGIITKDSLIMINRVDKQYYAYSFQTLSEKFNFELNFELFQSVLVGDLPIPQSPEDDIIAQSNQFIIVQNVGDLTLLNQIGTKTKKLEKLKASKEDNPNTLELKYTDFKMLEIYIFAFKADMTLQYFKDNKKSDIAINIEHNRARIEDEALNFPFSIPEGYERK
ncbi:MAG: hypothetical protein COW03_16300 [Cytophagales bacterium CG12_big_fil_rev_8_21_14_0_65_40_12]|nr:MAG: hypothetical protein COW03_16300 [Cytophagales bacterium CG12_big_fil_rev_8_21_14_0_65_40_12]PIW05290.1 MAG: hypothetical protein COW40_05115 [Cytophagales bacterium CG17_big_fil_post_rev_8_21_14_2_50_40_13]